MIGLGFIRRRAKVRRVKKEAGDFSKEREGKVLRHGDDSIALICHEEIL